MVFKDMTKKHKGPGIEEHAHSSDEEEEASRIEKSEEAMSYLPPEVYAEILQRDDLEVQHEYDLVAHLKNYMSMRDTLTKDLDLPPVEKLKPELWELLTPEEQKKRTTEYETRQKARVAKIEAEKKAQAEAYLKLKFEEEKKKAVAD